MGNRGGARPGAGRPRQARGETRRLELTLGENERDVLSILASEQGLTSTQDAIRYLIAQERKRQA